MAENASQGKLDGRRPQVCQFPTGPRPDEVCGRPVARTGEAGRPPRYCALPEHDRARAFTARRAFERAAVTSSGAVSDGGAAALDIDEDGLAQRPVSDARITLGVLLAQFRDEVTAQRRADTEHTQRMAELLDQAERIATTATDPDAAGYEVEQARRECDRRVSEIEDARASAERVADEQSRRADQETELRAQADEAAEEALRDATRTRAAAEARITETERRTRETVEAAESRARQAVADAAAARDELAQVREETSAAVAQAVADAEQARRDAHTERDLAIATAAEAARVQVDAATRRSDDDRALAERLRAELEQVRTEHRGEVEELRREARDERAAARAERTAITEQLRTLMAAVETRTVDDHS